jgi:hypothetical protein
MQNSFRFSRWKKLHVGSCGKITCVNIGSTLKYCAEIYVVRLGDYFLCIITVNHWRIMKGIIHIFLMWHNFPPICPVRLCCYCLKNLNFRFMEIFLINFELCHIFQQNNNLFGLPNNMSRDNNIRGRPWGSQFKKEDHSCMLEWPDVHNFCSISSMFGNLVIIFFSAETITEFLFCGTQESDHKVSFFCLMINDLLNCKHLNVLL